MARKPEEVSFSKGTAPQAEGTGCAMALRQEGARGGARKEAQVEQIQDGDSGDQTPFYTES